MSVVFGHRVLLTLLWLLVCLPHLVLSLHAAAYGTNKTVRREEEMRNSDMIYYGLFVPSSCVGESRGKEDELRKLSGM